MMKSMKIVKNYINGKWLAGENDAYLKVENPSTGEIIGETPLSTAAETDRAIDAADAAYQTWSRTPVARRVKPIFNLARLISENEEKLARSITEEMGKSLPDARAELKRAVENCEVACGMPVLQQGDRQFIRNRWRSNTAAFGGIYHDRPL